MAALPLPPSLLDWGGVIRSRERRLSIPFRSAFRRNGSAILVSPRFAAGYLHRPRLATSRSQNVLGFRALSGHPSFAERGQHFVDFDENRFVTRRTKGPAPFSYRVIFDAGEIPIEEGWQADSMDVRRMMKILPAHRGESR